jgi:hypothetical protein
MGGDPAPHHLDIAVLADPHRAAYALPDPGLSRSASITTVSLSDLPPWSGCGSPHDQRAEGGTDPRPAPDLRSPSRASRKVDAFVSRRPSREPPDDPPQTTRNPAATPPYRLSTTSRHHDGHVREQPLDRRIRRPWPLLLRWWRPRPRSIQFASAMLTSQGAALVVLVLPAVIVTIEGFHRDPAGVDDDLLSPAFPG